MVEQGIGQFKRSTGMTVIDSKHSASKAPEPRSDKPRLLLLSAYHAQSHAYWAEAVQQLDEFEWHCLQLPPRHFAWRAGGNAMSWALSEQALLAQRWDAVLATSMVDMARLKGLCPSLAKVPTILYFHENQFAYPPGVRQQGLVELQLGSIYSALAADALWFNSDWNRSSFRRGVKQLLGKMPDHMPLQAVLDHIDSRSEVLPVPIVEAESEAKAEQPLGALAEATTETETEAVIEKHGSKNRRLRILWNHRWEYDKGPERLLAIVHAAEQHGLALDWSIAGQQFRRQPEAFEAICSLLVASSSQRLQQFGFVESVEGYRKLLQDSDVVLSTALHDFQGLAVLQAVQAGCIPLCPDALCYGEWFAADYRYDVGAHTEGQTVGQKAAHSEALIATAAVQRLKQWQQSLPPLPSIEMLTWTQLGPRYRRMLSERVS